MTNKKRGLSRGLDALLSIRDSAINFDKNNNIDAQLVSYLNVHQLVPGTFQPRRTITAHELKELVESIKTQGVLQPLIVRLSSDNQYEIIAGERRWRAATQASLTEVPVIIKNVSDKQALTIALIENIQRENLNPLEEAVALDRLSKEFDLTHNDVATAVGKSRTAITNLLRILHLPQEIKNLLENGKIDLGHAKVLLGAPKHVQISLANKIVADNLSVRTTELLLSKLQTSKLVESKSKVKQDPDLLNLEKRISYSLGTKVTILTRKKSHKGRLIIEYNTLEQLDGILEHMHINKEFA